MLLDLVGAVARAGRLRTDVATAALAVHAAGSGVALSLIGVPAAERDPGLSHRVREAVLGSLTLGGSTAPDQPTAVQARAVHAVALAASLDDGASHRADGPLSEAESGLLVEWLGTIARWCPAG